MYFHLLGGERVVAVALDVGGTTFTTSKNTLVANSTYFKSIFRDGWPDDDYFLDRDPKTFELLLKLLRAITQQCRR